MVNKVSVAVKTHEIIKTGALTLTVGSAMIMGSAVPSIKAFVITCFGQHCSVLLCCNIYCSVC